MPDIARVIAAGAANPWIYLPAAVLLGALHALEPGHSKSIMAAFIVAIRGSTVQAVILGICAAIGHTMVVWALVLLAIWLGNDMIEQQAYPWLVLLSGILIIGIAVRLMWLMRPAHEGGHHHHHHDHPHDHDHDHPHDHAHHGHSHATPEEIGARFAGRRVGYGDIAWFGFTGGLLPCPSAIAVLLVALKLNAVALGAAMVAAFSIGLALTLVSVGVAAAWGTSKLSKWDGFDRWSRVLPIVSAGIVLALGLGVAIHGLLLVNAAA